MYLALVLQTVIGRTVAYLKVRTWNTLGKLSKQRLHNFYKLWGLNDIQNFLQLIQEHHLFRTMGLGPELQETHYNLEKSETTEWHNRKNMNMYTKM